MTDAFKPDIEIISRSIDRVMDFGKGFVDAVNELDYAIQAAEYVGGDVDMERLLANLLQATSSLVAAAAALRDDIKGETGSRE